MSQFKKAFNGIDSAIKRGTARALNRALSSTKTRMVRTLRKETGLKTDVVKSRTRAKKAKSNDLGVIFGIAIKYPIALSKFNPKHKNVKALYKDGTKRARVGATAKIGNQPRQLVPGGFLINTKGGGVALVGRKAAYNVKGDYVNSTVQGPLTTLKTTIFTEVAKLNEADAKRFIRDTFDKNVAHEIEFAIQKQFKSNK